MCFCVYVFTIIAAAFMFEHIWKKKKKNWGIYVFIDVFAHRIQMCVCVCVYNAY